MSKTIRDANDMRKFGVNYLTGEACRVGARILCDVTETGRLAVCDLLGLPRNTKFAENWNSNAVGSVMIPYEWFPMLRVWCLFQDGAHTVIKLASGECIGIYADDAPDLKDRLVNFHRETNNLDRTFHVVGSLPGSGTRCTHQMSGRTE